MSHRIALAVVLGTAGLSACAAQNLGEEACPAIVAIGPLTLLDYPEPNATNVPDNVETLIFSGTAPQKIELMPQVTGSTPIAAQPTALPSPLPSPIATPVTETAYGYYAVSVPRLAPMTTYDAQGLTMQTSGCGGTVEQYAGGGSFTTQ